MGPRPDGEPDAEGAEQDADGGRERAAADRIQRVMTEHREMQGEDNQRDDGHEQSDLFPPEARVNRPLRAHAHDGPVGDEDQPQRGDEPVRDRHRL